MDSAAAFSDLLQAAEEKGAQGLSHLDLLIRRGTGSFHDAGPEQLPPENALALTLSRQLAAGTATPATGPCFRDDRIAEILGRSTGPEIATGSLDDIGLSRPLWDYADLTTAQGSRLFVVPTWSLSEPEILAAADRQLAWYRAGAMERWRPSRSPVVWFLAVLVREPFGAHLLAVSGEEALKALARFGPDLARTLRLDPVHHTD